MSKESYERELGSVNTRLDHIEASQEEMSKDVKALRETLTGARGFGKGVIAVFAVFGGLMLAGLYTVIKKVGLN